MKLLDLKGFKNQVQLEVSVQNCLSICELMHSTIQNLGDARSNFLSMRKSYQIGISKIGIFENNLAEVSTCKI